MELKAERLENAKKLRTSGRKPSDLKSGIRTRRLLRKWVQSLEKNHNYMVFWRESEKKKVYLRESNKQQC